MQHLHLMGADHGADCELVIFVDGDDVLQRLDALGMEPDEVLSLLAAPGGHDEPRWVQVGRCGCGDPTCGAVSVRIGADGDYITWDSWQSTLGQAAPGRYRFARTQYEAELHRADVDRSWESAERGYARKASAFIDAEVRAALAWRGLRYESVLPAGDRCVAAHLSAAYGADRWAVFVVMPVSEDPTSVARLLSRRGPTAWDRAYWCGETPGATVQQPPMAGRTWCRWEPLDI